MDSLNPVMKRKIENVIKEYKRKKGAEYWMNRLRGKAIFVSQETYDEVKRQAEENGRSLGKQMDMIVLGRIVKR